MTSAIRVFSESTSFVSFPPKRKKLDKQAAATRIQRCWRRVVQTTFNQEYLRTQYQQREARKPSNIAPLFVRNLNIRNEADKKILNECLEEWKKFALSKTEEGTLPENDEDRLTKTKVLIESFERDLALSVQGISYSIAYDQNNEIQAIIDSTSYRDSSIRYIERLISSPINAFKKFNKEPHVQGAAAALIANEVFKSKNTPGNKTAVLLISTDSAFPFYEHVGFEDHSLNTIMYTHKLTGASLFQFLRKYGGRYTLVE